MGGLILFNEPHQEPRYGSRVIECDYDFLRPMFRQLIEVIAESLVSTSDYLKRALALRPPSAFEPGA